VHCPTWPCTDPVPPHSSVEPVFQLGLTIALSCAILAATLIGSTRNRFLGTVPPEARRVLIALERAGFTVMKRRLVRLPIPFGLAALAVCLAPQVFKCIARGTAFSISSTLASGIFFLAGAAVLAGLAHLSIVHIRRHAFSLWSAAHSGASDSLRACFTATASLLIAVQVAGILSMLCTFSALRMFMPASPNNPTLVGLSPSQLTICFGAGAVFLALWLQQMGANCVGATCLGTGATFESLTGLDNSDPRNPAVLVDALSNQLGDALPRILDGFVESCLVCAVSLMLFEHSNAQGLSAELAALASLPVLLKSFGLLASLFGLVSIRASEHEDLVRAVLRSQGVGQAVYASAAVGMMVWTLDAWTTAVAAIVALSILLLPALALLGMKSRSRNHLLTQNFEHAQRVPTTRRATSWGNLLPASPVLSLGLYAILFVLVSHFVPTGSGSDFRVATTAALIAFTSPSALSALYGTASVAVYVQSTATLAGKLGRLTPSEEAQRRTLRLSQALDRVAEQFSLLVSDGGILLCVVGTFALVPWDSSTYVRLLLPSMLAVLVAATLPGLVAIGESIRVSKQTSRTQVGEVERQLRGLLREGFTTKLPEDFIPSYRSSVELLARDATCGGVLAPVLTVALPLLMLAVSISTAKSAGPNMPLLAMYVLVAAAAGLVATHAGHAASLPNSFTSRHRVTHTPAAVVPDARFHSLALIDFLRRSIAVSVPLLTKTSIFVALAAAATLS